MCRGAVISSIQSANNTLTRGVSLNIRSGSSHGNIHNMQGKGVSYHGGGANSGHGSLGCLPKSTSSLVGTSGSILDVSRGAASATGSITFLNGHIDTGDYDVPHPHPNTHHYMQTSTSLTPPHSTMNFVESQPTLAGVCSAHNSSSDSSQDCTSIIGGLVPYARDGHLPSHFGSGVLLSSYGHSGNGSLVRCSSRCNNTEDPANDDTGDGSGGSGCGGDIGSTELQHGHLYQFHGHHEFIHYERLPIPLPIPLVQTQVQSEEESEPAYATGKKTEFSHKIPRISRVMLIIIGRKQNCKD